MILRPASREDLAQSLRAATGAGKKIARIDLTRFNRVLEHTPEDMTVTVETGMTLAALQAALGRFRQWVPIDPPHPERLTIRELLDRNASGPRRLAHGTIRDHLLGVRVALADGRIVHSGGKVVKNVAGYDLLKLFVGAQGSLGVVVEAAFKLLPMPEAEQFVQARCESGAEVERLLRGVAESEVRPVVLDLHRPSSCAGNPAMNMVAGVAGATEDVAWQLARLGQMGFKQSATLDYDAAFHAEAAPHYCLSVLPSKLVEAVIALGPVPFTAHAGNGLIRHRDGPAPAKLARPIALIERMRAAFDPCRIFPEPSW